MRLNWSILFPAILLFFIGIFNLVGVRSDLVSTQVIAGVFALVFFIILKARGINFFKNNSVLFYWLGIALLVLTYFIGFESRGSKRWIDLYFFSFQASEFFKPFFAIFIAQYFVVNKNWTYNYNTVLKGIGYFLLPAMLVLRQPDLGTTLVYASMFVPVLVYSGVPRRILTQLTVVSLILAPIFWLVLKEYQRVRLLSFLDPQADTQGSGYNLVQSIIAIGSGKVLGRGLGYGTQAKLNFLPEFHTDFAFASLVEQFGFIGGLLVISIFVIFIRACAVELRRKYSQKDDDGKFRFLYQLSIFSSIVFQAGINIGMNMGLFPITGITLPFISYGGSSLIALFTSLAFLH